MSNIATVIGGCFGYCLGFSLMLLVSPYKTWQKEIFKALNRKSKSKKHSSKDIACNRVRSGLISSLLIVILLSLGGALDSDGVLSFWLYVITFTKLGCTAIAVEFSKQLNPRYYKDAFRTFFIKDK